MIKIKIDVTKIDKAKLFKGKINVKTGTAPVYLDAVLIETKPTQYGDYRDDQTHMIVQEISREERLAGKKGNILGNATDLSMRRTNDQAPADPGKDEGKADDTEDDDVPF